MRNLISAVSEKSFFDVEDFIYIPSGNLYPPLYKVLQTNFCEYDCKYCINNKYTNVERFFFKPQNLAVQFMQAYKSKKVGGLFLSSGIFKNPDFIQEKMLETVILLRKKINFRGFIHCKVLPHVSLSLIEKFKFLVDRISINIETSSALSLKNLSNKKSFKDILKKIQFLSYLSKRFEAFKAGVCTQIIVGVDDVPDKKILELSHTLLKNFSLKRIYFSGFQPLKGTPLEKKKPCPSLRVKRLYQAEYLMRLYKFNPQDFLYTPQGNLIYDLDPKEASALKYSELFPVNVNKADFELLLRVPGIGVKLARRILSQRKLSKFKNFSQLKKIGVNEKARKYVKF